MRRGCVPRYTKPLIRLVPRRGYSAGAPTYGRYSVYAMEERIANGVATAARSLPTHKYVIVPNSDCSEERVNGFVKLVDNHDQHLVTCPADLHALFVATAAEFEHVVYAPTERERELLIPIFLGSYHTILESLKKSPRTLHIAHDWADLERILMLKSA